MNLQSDNKISQFFQRDIFCGFLAVLITLIILRAYLDQNVFHSSYLDQQYLIPPMLHGIRLAWIGEGSFFFNFVTAEPMWGEPHYSPFYPFYGSISVIMYDFFGVEDYMVIGDYIALFHRLVLAAGCYYLSRTVSKSRLAAICFAIFVATSEAVRIPANWYMATSAYAWVPFMIGACIDIYNFRYFKGVSILITSTVLSVYAAPIYLGLGIAIIPCSVILAAYTVRFLIRVKASGSKAETNKNFKSFGVLVLAAIGLILMLMPILWAAYAGSGELIRWLRSGASIGRSSISVGSELFFETQELGYIKRLVADYGARGVFSSYFLGGVVAILFFVSPLIWLSERHLKPKAWLNIRLVLWGLALLHLSFIFGEKLIIPKLLYYTPVVSSFRHLSAFGTAFIILASLCAFDGLRVLLRLITKTEYKGLGLKRLLSTQYFLAVVSLVLIWALVLYFSDDKSLIVAATLMVLIFYFIQAKFSLPLRTGGKVALAILIILTSIGIYQQQTTRFSQPLTKRAYEDEVAQIDQLFEGIPSEGELINAKVSKAYSKRKKSNAMNIQSYLSTKNYRPVLSYKTPRHHKRFAAGMQILLGDLENMIKSGVTLLVMDKAIGEEIEAFNIDSKQFELVISTTDFNLYRLQENSVLREDAKCLSQNICGHVNNANIDFSIYPYNEIVFKYDGVVVPHSPVSGRPFLSRLEYRPDAKLEMSYKPKSFVMLVFLALVGLLMSLFSLSILKRQDQSSDKIEPAI